jgi:large subunit ribosomal protein L24
MRARCPLASQAGSLCSGGSFMSRLTFHVKKGDQVEVISGNFKGSSGKILEVLPRKQRVLVEGVRIIKKHMRKSQDNPQGKIAEREGPIHISNVKLIDGSERAEKKKATKSEKQKKRGHPERSEETRK